MSGRNHIMRHTEGRKSFFFLNADGMAHWTPGRCPVPGPQLQHFEMCELSPMHITHSHK